MIMEVYDLCGKYSCGCIILLYHVHSCYKHMHRARSVRKSYNYSRVLLSLVREKVKWLFWSALVDYVVDLWSWPCSYNIVRCPRRGTMQLHTLLGRKVADMHMHCICTLWSLFILKFYVRMKWVMRRTVSIIWGVLFHL
jgi:hypothetical protein